MSCRMWRKAFGLSAAAVLMALMGCKGNGREARMEKPIPVATPLKSPEAPAAPLPPPTPADVASAMRRIFGDDLLPQSGKGQWFIVGDFNGDNSQDVAVIARVRADKLEEVNSELANWTIQDADKFFVPRSNKRVVRLSPISPAKVGSGEEVLAIIHGYGPKGWRNPDARQAYVVRHAAAKFVGLAPSISIRQIRAMHLPVQTDIIKEIRDNKKGFLFWTGGAYAWHPDKG